MRWYFNCTNDLYFRQFSEQDCIVFNAASGQTHYLAESAITILNLLQQRALDLSDLASALEQEYEGLPPDIDLQRYISSVISQLDNIGLIEPVPP